MKYRSDFVTNSSSSSFLIQKKHLTESQIDHIKRYHDYSKLKGWEDEVEYRDNGWDISETDETIGGFTIVDNFNMERYLQLLGIDMTVVEWNY